MSAIKSKVLKICNDAKKASAELAELDSSRKEQLILEVVKLLKKHTQKIISDGSYFYREFCITNFLRLESDLSAILQARRASIAI